MPRRYLPGCVLIAAALLSACEPYDHHYAPPVAGQVVSAATNQPVAGALVSMTAEDRSVEAYTDEEGRFALPRLHRWGSFPFADADESGLGVLRIDAPGYQLYTEANIGRPIVLPGNGKTGNHDHYAHRSVDWQHIEVPLTAEASLRQHHEPSPLPSPDAAR